jgi:hypothetical protein
MDKKGFWLTLKGCNILTDCHFVAYPQEDYLQHCIRFFDCSTSNYEKKNVLSEHKKNMFQFQVNKTHKFVVYPTEFASSIQNPKKRNFPKKSMFSTFKVQRSQKFVWELPDGICSGSLKNNRLVSYCFLSSKNINLKKSV